MSDSKLKPCPFCGGEAEITFSGRIGDNWRGYIVAKCEICGASSKGAFYYGPEIEIDLEETVGGEKAMKAWNMRTGNNE